jgi:hypothetical protein
MSAYPIRTEEDIDFLWGGGLVHAGRELGVYRNKNSANETKEAGGWWIVRKRKSRHAQIRPHISRRRFKERRSVRKVGGEDLVADVVGEDVVVFCESVDGFYVLRFALALALDFGFWIWGSICNITKRED